MLKRGITITNYLATGDPEGVIFAYMSNWTGQATKIPRNLFADSKNFEELQRPGVYFLVGQDLSNPEDKVVYVGEANNLSERLAQHLRDSEKSFVETLICFSSKDENLTVSHTKYLEQRIIKHITKSNDFRLINKKEGYSINLPKMVQDEMDTFFDNIQILLPTLGHNILHTTTKVRQSNRDPLIFNLEVGKLKAESVLTSNGLEVLKGSEMNKQETPSLSGTYSNIRKTLLEKNIVTEVNGKYAFNENYEFSSPSTAAAIILGYSVNGRVAWKNSRGKTLKETEDENIDSD